MTLLVSFCHLLDEQLAILVRIVNTSLKGDKSNDSTTFVL